MVSPSTRGGGGPPRKPGNQSGGSSVSTNKNQRGQNSQTTSATDSASRGRNKSGEMRRPVAPGPSPSARSSERGGAAGRHAPSVPSPPHSQQQHRSYPTSRPSGVPVVRRVSRSPPPTGSNHHSPTPRARPSSGRFSSRHRSSSFSPKPPGGATVIKRSVEMARATSGSPKRAAHARLSSPAKRNRSKSPGERYEVSLPASHFTDRSSSRPSGIGGRYSELEQFRGPELNSTFDINELQKITVGIKRNVSGLGLDPLGRPLHPDNVVLQRRPDRYPDGFDSRDNFDSSRFHANLEDAAYDSNGSGYEKVSPPSEENESRIIVTPSELPLHYHIPRKCEGVRPMFDRAEIREGIEKRKLEERESSGLLRAGQESPPRIEQRVVAIIREPVILPVRGRSRERRYYEEEDRRERRGDSRDRHYSSSRYHGRDSPPPRHYDRRRIDDLRLDLEMRRRDSERGHRRSRSRDRDYYHRSSRHPESYRDYRDREREMRDREHRHRDERDHRGGHPHSSRDREPQRGGQPYRRGTPPPGHRGERDERGGFPPRPSGGGEGFPPNANRPAPELPPGAAAAPPATRPPPTFDPEYVPKGRAYFEHDNRDTFVPMGRGRGGFPPPFAARGGFIPRGGFPPRGRGRGGYPPGPPPFHHGGPPPFFPRGGPRGSFTRTKRRSPDWKHDLFETADQDQKPSSTTSEN